MLLSLRSLYESSGGSATGLELGGGIAWPYPPLSQRHWSAPPSSSLKVGQSAVARPRGVSAGITCGTVTAHGLDGNVEALAIIVAFLDQEDYEPDIDTAEADALLLVGSVLI